MIFGQTGSPGSHPEIGAAHDALKLAPLLFSQGRTPQRGFGIDKRDGERSPAQFRRSVTYQHRIVAQDMPGGIGIKNVSYARHAQRMQLGRAQRAQAGTPRDGDSARKQIEYFFVPDGRRHFETAVDQTDRGRRIHDQGRQIAADGGRPHINRVRHK